MSLPPPPQGRNPFFRRQTDPFAHIRRNQRIKAPEIRVIGPEGQQLGVMSVERALQISTAAGLDLVEVAPNAQPPVCRILDFGKYKYEEQKKQHGAKSAGSKIKEVKLRVRIEQHDFDTKMRHAEAFLHHGNKLKLTLQFRGREMAYKDQGFETMKRAIIGISHIGHPDQEPKLMGRSIVVMVTPLPANKRKLKYNEPSQPVHEPEPEADDEGDDEGDEAQGAGPAAHAPKA